MNGRDEPPVVFGVGPDERLLGWLEGAAFQHGGDAALSATPRSNTCGWDGPRQAEARLLERGTGGIARADLRATKAAGGGRLHQQRRPDLVAEHHLPNT